MKLTLEHFFDNPSWAAAAGYKFNLLDCLSDAANKASIREGVKQLISNIPDIELRSVWWELPFSILAVISLVTWPLTFWVVGLLTYAKCIRCRNKYLGSENPTFIKNLRNWHEECDRRIRRGKTTKA